MTRTPYVLLAVATVCTELVSQSNSRGPGYNGALYEISSARAWGRRGAAYPGGEVGVSFQNGLCNPGTMALAWYAADNSPTGTQMSEDHPKFSFLVAKEQNGRLVQISDWSYCKHAFVSTNTPGTCGTCGTQPWAEQMFVGCSDIYSNSNNGSRTYLGPPAEINPWLGTWNHVGSYFDVGDPANGSPNDGIKGTINPGTDEVKNRVTIKETDVQGGLTTGLYFQIQVIHEGEPVTNRDNNIMSRPFGLTWSGSSWTASTPGTPTFGSILTRWAGSTLTSGQNGNDDGRFFVAVKVTGPSNGFWHYEYIVHNVDNNRGGAAFRLPMCPTARVQNFGFRDIDQNALNDWTPSFAGNEIAWTAPANNSQRWNQLFNFWFDCDVSPAAGNATIDQALIGPGALTVTVPTTVPGYQTAVYAGPGCGAPSCELTAEGDPLPSNPTFNLRIQTDPLTPFLLFYSLPGTSFPVAPGCTVFIDLAACGDYGFAATDPSGIANVPTPVDPTWPAIMWQAATFIPNPPVLGLIGLSNGLIVRYNSTTGCY